MLVTEQSVVVAWQLGNLYLLMAFIGIAIYSSTTEVKVIKNYLFALWLGDIGHIAFSCYGLGSEMSLNLAGWNAMAWGNIAATVSSLSVSSSLCYVNEPSLTVLRGRFSCS